MINIENFDRLENDYRNRTAADKIGSQAHKEKYEYICTLSIGTQRCEIKHESK